MNVTEFQEEQQCMNDGHPEQCESFAENKWIKLAG
jgi:hypothetical protein